ncbi:transcriptional regulator, TetR family [Micromonospora rhizosphaerae]|uniref:Transcriptional regulator, TetR family n=1 Tax=Micromonospora rhizosphaerae TaxID=568872 RepID=A0A1C6T6J0_9ACTN|nr:TetR/AcrR family transcriptional regulator [Micromonospora rhizosphaerae]SCL37277.1 transcriptional regulator, TetR family [Micromonospora rhizosphaerae]
MASVGVPEIFARRPKRADARRNYEALVAAAREAFGERGTSASLEDIARRARVGIGTLYRHFPTRRELLEAVYVDEVEALCRSAAELADLPPWDAFVAWINRFVAYVATKRALAEELVDSEVFRGCRTAIYAAGEPMLRRAQAAGVARPDATFDDVLRLLSGITTAQFTEPGQRDRVLVFALDGLRYPTAAR